MPRSIEPRSHRIDGSHALDESPTHRARASGPPPADGADGTRGRDGRGGDRARGRVIARDDDDDDGGRGVCDERTRANDDDEVRADDDGRRRWETTTGARGDGCATADRGVSFGRPSGRLAATDGRTEAWRGRGRAVGGG